MSTILKASIRALCTALIRILARIQRGAVVLSGVMDTRPGPFASVMTGTVAAPVVGVMDTRPGPVTVRATGTVQNLTGTAGSRSSASGALTQTPPPKKSWVVVARERIQAFSSTQLGIQLRATVLGGLLVSPITRALTSLGKLLLWIEQHTLAWLMGILKIAEHWLVSH